MGSDHTWIGAARSYNWWPDRPYPSAVAMNTSPYPQDYWVVNGCIHNGVTNWFENTGITWTPGLKEALRSYYDNYDSVGLQGVLSANIRNYSQYIPQMTDTHVFESGSWTDAFQFLDKSLRAWSENPVTPLRLYAAANGHEDAEPLPDVNVLQRQYQDEWHARWLKDQNPPGLPDREMIYLYYKPDGTHDHATTTVWPPTWTTPTTYYFHNDLTLTTAPPIPGEGSHTLTNAWDESFYTVQYAVNQEEPDYKTAITGRHFVRQQIAFYTERFEYEQWWLGAPEVTLYTQLTDPASGEYNIHLIFVDEEVDTGGHVLSSALITRADLCWHPGDPSTRTVEGVPHARLIGAGHRIKVVVENMAVETSMPSKWKLRMRPVFGDRTVNIFHQATDPSNVILPLGVMTGQGSGLDAPFFRLGTEWGPFFDGVASAP